MSANRGFAEIEIRGVKKFIKFDLNATADLEEYFGIGFAQIMSEQKVGFSTLRAMYWAGLKWTMKGLTIPQAGVIVQEKLENGESMQDLFKPVLKAMQNSGLMGKNDDSKEVDPLEGILNSDSEEEEGKN
jgi:hypothetical protein